MSYAVEEVRNEEGHESTIQELRARIGVTIKRFQVPAEEVLDLVTQMAIMFDSGLNLSSALEVLEKQAGSKHMKAFVGKIRMAVEDGRPLSWAMGQHGWAFSPAALALVRAGEMTGDLGKMLGKVAAFMERDINTRKKVKGAMAYPAFMAILAVIVVIFLLVNVFPKFAVLFENSPDKLPGPTKFFLALSDFMRAHGSWLLPGAVVVLGGTIFLIRSRRGREIFDPIWLKMPAFGALIRAVAISRSFHVLGVMLNAGLNVLEAIRLAAQVSTNNEYTKLWTQARMDVENGGDISASLMDNPLIPAAETAMISLGERSGTLPTVLEKITAHHEKKVDTAIKAFVGVIEPAMTIIMGGVVALIVSSLIMPMFAISQVMN
ncbi:MAG: type II secretion system F family protein [Planctomycetota bacterium]|jgi:type IV pilus assembly protein PilC